MPAASFKELMGQLKEDTNIEVAAPDKKKLADHYNFTEGWYDALLNSDKAIRTNTQVLKFTLTLQKASFVEIGVYEGASSCFWSDFYSRSRRIEPDFDRSHWERKHLKIRKITLDYRG